MQPLIILALALLQPAFGMPTEKRDAGDVQLFTGENYGGDSLSFFVGAPSDGQASCKELPAPYKNNLGSFKVSPQTLCRLFSSAAADCSGHGLIISDSSTANNAVLFTTGSPEIASGPSVGQNAAYIGCILCTGCP